MEVNDNLRSADEELKESHVELLSRFYKLFESVHRYYIELNSFLQDLDDGRFIQTSLESVFQDMDGKQLLVSDKINYLSIYVDVHWFKFQETLLKVSFKNT